MQITANHLICTLLFFMLFGTLICSDLRLICSLQITANQSLPTFKKHCKTRANQCKSLQITPPKSHRKKVADLQPQPPLNPNRPQAPRPKKRTKRKRFNVDTFDCNVSALAEAIQRIFRHPPTPSLDGGARRARSSSQNLFPKLVKPSQNPSQDDRLRRRPSQKVAP